ncbi:MAG: chemotaxis protein CheW [Gemmatimonadaceae bacterium]
MIENGETLRRRARALARVPVERGEDAVADQMHLLVVSVDGERMALPIERIAAISRASVPAPLPRAVAPVYGVAVWRGRPLTVLSISAAEPVVGPDSRFVVLGDARRADVALLVDEVDDVHVVSRMSITAASPSMRHVALLGITADAMLIVDAASLVRDRRESPQYSPDSTRTA